MRNGSSNTKKQLQTRLLFISTFILLFFSGCALLRGNKEIKEITFSYSPTSEINYGHTFSINTMLVYTDGKDKDITNKNDLVVTVEGGEYAKGKITIDGHPETLRPDTVHIKAVYTDNEKTYTVSESIPFNYRGALLIDFSGEVGAEGARGDNKGTPWLFSNGKAGGDGLTGADGGNGHDLSVNIWKEKEGNRYRISVSDLTTNKRYEYTYINTGFGIQFDVRGGQGGNGGEGGDGGDGKDGSIEEKKTRTPGDGGNGGIGGNGGNGGNGGMVYVFVHPTAEELVENITVYNFAGPLGNGGKGGKAGNGGEPAGDQDLAPDGVAGADGIDGQAGQRGPQFQIVVEAFDIEN